MNRGLRARLRRGTRRKTRSTKALNHSLYFKASISILHSRSLALDASLQQPLIVCGVYVSSILSESLVSTTSNLVVVYDLVIKLINVSTGRRKDGLLGR